jgi:Mg-chelatase subunit ChlD
MTMMTPGLAMSALLAAVGVPVLIHLLFRRRYQIIPWAAIRFLLSAEHRRQRRLEQWLLLTLRIFGLALPLAAMVATTDWAEPLWQRLWPGTAETVVRTPRTHHIVVIDGSLSLTARADSGKSCWEHLQQQAQQLLEHAGTGDAFSLLYVGEGAEVVVPGPSIDTERISREMAQLSPTHGATPLAAALPLIQEILERSPPTYPRKQITFLTDLQRSAWHGILRTEESTDKVSDSWKQLVRRTDVVIMDVGQRNEENLSVTEVRLSEAAPIIHSPVQVTAVITNNGQQKRHNVIVQLLVGRPGSDYQKPIPIEQIRIATLAAGERVTVVFGQQTPLRFESTGQHLVVVEVAGEDVLQVDDRRGLVASARAAIPVRLIEGRPEAQGARRTAADLQRALLPDEAASEWTPARPRTWTVPEFLDPAVGALDEVAAIYLCDLPLPAPDWVARLEGFAQRGGAILIGLGPQAARHLEDYNRVLHRAGQGILPFPLEEVVSATDEQGSFRLTADEESFRQPLLALFRDERVRGGLINVPFRRYVRVRPPNDPSIRRWLDFTPVRATPGQAQRDPALLEWNWRHGRVFLFTSSFNEDWNDWPPLPTYLPFHQELLRYAAVSPNRYTLTVGDTLEEFFPVSYAGLAVRWWPPTGEAGRTLRLSTQGQMAVARTAPIRVSGLYRLVLQIGEERLFWVNPPTTAPGFPAESDLHRLTERDLTSLQPLQVVQDASAIVPTITSGAIISVVPRPRGPQIARWLVILALVMLFIEMLLAWRWGPATGIAHVNRTGTPANRRQFLYFAPWGILPLVVVGLLTFVWIAEFSHTLPEWLPSRWRQSLEQTLRAQESTAGESTALRLEHPPLWFRQPRTDRWTLLAISVAMLSATGFIYWRERRATNPSLVWMPAMLRASCWALLLFIFLLQWSVSLERAGWPDLVVLVDTSRSMAHADDYKDPAIRARIEAFLQNSGSMSATRWQLVQRLLTDSGADGLAQLLRNYQVRLHLFAIDRSIRSIATIEDETELPPARQAIHELKADGDASVIGEGIQAVVKAFRGAPLVGIIVFTDGVITAGPDWATVAQEAAQAGIPLYLVGIGDAWESPDLILADLQSEDTVTIGDRVVLEARLSLHGSATGNPVPVILYEKEPATGQLNEVGRTTVTPPAGGAPVTVTLSHIPTTAGVKNYVLQVPPLPGETQLSNNRLERTIWVTEARRLRVLFIEGRPRYDFRFLKALLERESDRSLGGRSFEVETLLLNASQGWASTDRSAFRGDFPTREQLFQYDVILLGDCDPSQLPHAWRSLKDLADFVAVKGGGMLFLSGAHFTPAAWAQTPLAAILPVTPWQGSRPPAADDIPPTGFRLQLTELGQQHPSLRLHPDSTQSLRLWKRLPPLYWHAANGYRRKPQAIVLATLAANTPDIEPTPLILQMFAGSGTVLFFGFDDLWRWRQQEELYDRFWLQTIRFLARSRVRRPELRILPKTEFRQDETIKVVVRFPVEAPPPTPQQPIRVTLVRRPLASTDHSPAPPAGETQTLTLARVPAAIPQYETILSRTPEGEYLFTLTEPEPPPGQPPPSAVVRVLPPWSELDRLELDRRNLQEAAARSNGRFFTLADVDALWNQLPSFPRVPLHQADPPTPLWNHPLLYLLLVLLLGSEWLLRKLARLL